MNEMFPARYGLRVKQRRRVFEGERKVAAVTALQFLDRERPRGTQLAQEMQTRVSALSGIEPQDP